MSKFRRRSMVSDKKLTNAVGGRSARACDNCIKRRARCYCAADDAFLCQLCDSSVHSANPLARRHERVLLKTTSVSSLNDESKSRLQISVPSWHKGFTRKARTPRKKKKNHEEGGQGEFSARILCNNWLHLVPEIGGEELCNEDDEEQLVYRVPVLDPFAAELCSPNDAVSAEVKGFSYESKTASFDEETKRFDMDVEEFAVDVERLLGRGLEDQVIDMEGLGIVGNRDEDRVKVEEEEIARERMEMSYDNDCRNICEEEDGKDNRWRKNFLRLNYDGVLSAWESRKCPWTTGKRPRFNPADCWPDISSVNRELMNVYGDHTAVAAGAATAAASGGGREARVWRYREKRRTRLFAKKIRYEVRKRNAENRPRMKGRFVKTRGFC